MKKILYVPIIHSINDYSDTISRTIYLNSLKGQGISLKEEEKSINIMWDKIDSDLAKRKIDRIYQDGHTEKRNYDYYERFATKQGSRNFQTICQLVKKGGLLTVTEKTPHNWLDLDERDTNISDIINNSLEEGQTGVLFMGRLHKVIKNLEKNEDIQVEIIDYTFT